jgi:hypothetical protein
MSKTPDPLELAIAGEKATSLGLSARKLGAALEALRRFDASSERRGPARRGVSRKRLVDDAAEACWEYLVQRELLSLGAEDAEYIRREYEVPDEVWKGLGAKRNQ